MKRRDFLWQAAVGGAALTLTPGMMCGRAPGTGSAGGRVAGFNRGWDFIRGDVQEVEALASTGPWEQVSLPHTAKVEALVTGPPGSDTFQWQGTAWYRRRFTAPPNAADQAIWLKFEGAMNVADVWLNGELLGRHLGGWLPFVFDLSGKVRPGAENTITVRLDNRDNTLTGPKPLKDLDFNPYGGLYRDVHLIIKDRLHITDPILAGKVASGGLFAHTLSATPDRAEEWVQVHVRNASEATRTFTVAVSLADDAGRAVVQSTSAAITLAPGEDTEVAQTLEVTEPHLWSPASPSLYTLKAEVREDGRVVDSETTRVGLRRFEISAEGFRINGERLFLRGTNRHQEYPHVGYALSADAQYRDALKIKSAGFDYVRLSHYLHDPAFMAACDELGLVVMDCIPGWQYFDRESAEFEALQLDNCRQMIRRDRNHACVILWEVSLNESWMTDSFIEASHAIAHEEYPFDTCYSCGWTDGYDVFIQARQHGGCTEETDRACLVSEYGDWEYYAQNAGLNQTVWADLAADEANSRQLRWHGEEALLQQATNFQEAHNDNLKTIAFADGLWVMYDYNRGYAPDIESSGCMDLFRIPKFSYYFFRSQRPPTELLGRAESGPMVFIANHWTPDSPTDVRVFSNCDEVELRLNGRVAERRQPDADRLSTHLAHPPFTFSLGGFEAGTLEAVAYLEGQEAARHVVQTPGSPARLRLHLDEGGRAFGADGKDVAFVHAYVEDEAGTVCPDAWVNVFFGVAGHGEIVGTNPSPTEAGIAGAVVQTSGDGPAGPIRAMAVIERAGESHVLQASTGPPAEGEIRFTTDGSAPTLDSATYSAPLPDASNLRATWFFDGTPVVEAAANAPRFRLAGSVAPEA